MSLTNKDKEGCTIILCSFYYKHILKDQQQDIKDYSLAKGSLIYSRKDLFLKDLLDQYYIDQEPVLCNKFTIYILHLDLLYRLTILLKSKHITILPQFIEFSLEYSNLKVTTRGTQKELSKAHFNLLLGLLSPLGLPNQYRKIPYYYLPSFPMHSLRLLLDALVSQQCYNDYKVH